MSVKITKPRKGTLTGKRFDYWKVLEQLPPVGKKQLYKCRCKCGIEKPVQATNLVRRTSRSCGCKLITIKRRGKFVPRMYGNFYIESISHYHSPTHAVYNVRCNCGKKVKLLSTNYRHQTGCSKDCPYTKLRIEEVLNKLRK